MAYEDLVVLKCLAVICPKNKLHGELKHIGAMPSLLVWMLPTWWYELENPGFGAVSVTFATFSHAECTMADSSKSGVRIFEPLSLTLVEEVSTMAEFFVEINAQDNGEHVVHKSNCSLLPAKDALRYLGSIASAASAVKKAQESFKLVNGCSHCTS
ncbi:hypothetical protein QZJ86_10380 [Methylomonas montana]|uniref:hypothetical protein n=1 Tax=Methylomonas montana TaxID=3058963 RepID=UPI002659CEE8|nr:hypothetical protein [Methylomonas montana]WKJ92526.1 hypothetical protein QZJ86_10380 [Methylomonas montana]